MPTIHLTMISTAELLMAQINHMPNSDKEQLKDLLL